MNTAITMTPVSDSDFEALAAQAGEAGDLEQVDLCEAALAGDYDARIVCERVIFEARANAQE